MTKSLMLTLGMLGGAVSLLPFSDNFSRADGPLGNGWTSPTWTIASGRAVNTPTLSSEILSNPTFDVNTTGWSPSSASLLSVAGGQTNNALQVTRIAGTAQDAFAPFTSTIGEWYLYSAWIKSGTSGDESAALAAQMNDGAFTILFSNTAPSTGSWVQRFLSFRSTNAAMRFNLRKISSTAGTMLFDTASNKLISTPSLFALRQAGNANVTIQVKITRIAGTQAGLITNANDAASPTDFIIAYLDGTGNCKLDECVAGVYVNKITVAVTYVADAILKIVRSGTLCQVFYNGVQVGTNQTMSANINTLHGLFSTFSQNSFGELSITNP